MTRNAHPLGWTAPLLLGFLLGCSKETAAPPPSTPPASTVTVEPPRVQVDSLTMQAQAATGARHEVLLVADGANFQMLPPTLTVQSGDAIRFRAMSGAHVLTLDPFGVTAADSAMAQFRANVGPGVGRNATPLVDGNGAVFELSTGGLPAGLYRVHSTAYQDFGVSLSLTVLGKPAATSAP